MERTCDCGKAISRRNASGKCRSCIALHLNADPVIKDRRIAAIKAAAALPGAHDKKIARLREYHQNMPDAERHRRREQGKRIYARVLSSPEARAKSLAARLQPDVRARQGRSHTRNRLPWLPEDLVQLYRDLTRKGLLAHEAREAMQPMIPGTPEHTARTIANFNDVARIREERRRAQAY